MSASLDLRCRHSIDAAAPLPSVPPERLQDEEDGDLIDDESDQDDDDWDFDDEEDGDEDEDEDEEEEEEGWRVGPNVKSGPGLTSYGRAPTLAAFPAMYAGRA